MVAVAFAVVATVMVVKFSCCDDISCSSFVLSAAFPVVVKLGMGLLSSSIDHVLEKEVLVLGHCLS